MKKIILFLVFIAINTNCRAQIIDMYGSEYYGEINGAYYKDVNNFNNQYLGTWLYTNGNTSLTITFISKSYLSRNNGKKFYYTDAIFGGYQYVENGVQKVNTLSNLNTNYGNNFYSWRDNCYLVPGHKIKATSKPICTECLSDEWRLKMYLGEPDYDGMGVSSNSFVIRRFFEGGVEKLKVWFINTTQIAFEDSSGNISSPAPYSLPTGEYVLIKQ